jgi:hypothetical protein
VFFRATSGNLENLKGKLNTIEVELANFNQKAKQQIKTLELKAF